MKNLKITIGLLLLGLIILITGNVSTLAGGTGSFTIGAYWQPPAKPVDYNTIANWANIYKPY